ncbi:MAG: sulfite exporter TauE/SafE family protein [Anaerolineae bacterium]|jgi:hypothetical protein|nr:sulfite exporter TauE/SafE family protein [Anaerolineae bacterium]
MESTIILLITGIGAGVFSGMFGIGGGVIIVPILMVFFLFSPTEAVSTSLAALLLPVGIFAVISYYRNGLLDVRASAILAFGLLITTLIGSVIALNLPGETLKQVYGGFLLYMGWRFAEPRKFWAALRQHHPATPPPISEVAPDAVWYTILIVGLVAGVFSGMFGIGGGAIIVPALVGLLKYDQKRAVGTSLGALLPPVGLPAVINYYQADQLNLGAALPVAIGLAAGALIGARVAIALPSATVKRLYGVFLLGVGTWFIVQPLVEAALTR